MRGRDPERTRGALEAWLARALSPADVTNIRGPAATGYSHETIIFDAGDRSLVARVEPTTHSLFLDADFSKEWRILRALSDTDVKAPRVLAFESDRSYFGAPFFVMEHVRGEIPPDNPPYTFGGWLAEATPEQQARVWWSGFDAMIDVHVCDWKPFDFLVRTAPGFDDELDYYRRNFVWTTQDKDLPIARAALHWLIANRSSVIEGKPALCWGDSRLGNQIFDDFECAALLDWEMAAISDPEQDLAWWLYFDRFFSDGLGVPRPAGFPPPDETVAHYEDRTGRIVRNLGYYTVFAAFRFAVVMLRLGTFQKTTGELPPDSDFDVDNFATTLLARVLDEVAAVPAAGD
jgi:aminoglycoside phosphotransferase (APT) family kinase protein